MWWEKLDIFFPLNYFICCNRQEVLVQDLEEVWFSEDEISTYDPGWSGTWEAPTSVCIVLRLQLCTTTP